MAVEIQAKMKPKNNNTFALIDAVDVLVDESKDTRLDAVLSTFVKGKVGDLSVKMVNGYIPLYWNTTNTFADDEISGVLMTGTPTKDYHAANKKYVDEHVPTIDLTSIKTEIKNSLSAEFYPLPVNQVGDKIGIVNMNLVSLGPLTGKYAPVNKTINGAVVGYGCKANSWDVDKNKYDTIGGASIGQNALGHCASVIGHNVSGGYYSAVVGIRCGNGYAELDSNGDVINRKYSYRYMIGSNLHFESYTKTTYTNFILIGNKIEATSNNQIALGFNYQPLSTSIFSIGNTTKILTIDRNDKRMQLYNTLTDVKYENEIITYKQLKTLLKSHNITLADKE